MTVPLTEEGQVGSEEATLGAVASASSVEPLSGLPGDGWLVLVFLHSPNSDLLITFPYPCSVCLEVAICDLLAWPLCSLTLLLGSARGRLCWRGSLLTWPAMVWAVPAFLL